MKVEQRQTTERTPWIRISEFEGSKSGKQNCVDSLWIGFNTETSSAFIVLRDKPNIQQLKLKITPEEFLKVVEEFNKFASIVEKSSKA